MESMNNKDPFETFLEKQSFSEKASESLRMKLDNSASWNRPWWKSPTVIALLAAGLIVVISFLLLLAARSAVRSSVVPLAEQFAPPASSPQPLPVVVEPPPPVIAQNGENSMLSPFSRQLADSEPEFNLSFIDRPVNLINARREYADLI
ncbi:MAG: hypothetical protein ACD_39C01513G0002 [uncultured bacterium]|nr:MAG: hypothetical protein ACD_39C01513G0002 [uncultured bacterium]